MTPEQVRAARGWLAWSQQELADRAHVGLSTIKDFESGKRTPVHNNVMAIRTALEAAGMQIGPGMVSGPVASPRDVDGALGG